MHMRYLTLSALLFCLTYAENSSSSSVETAFKAFIPQGWILIDKAEGDLNGDGLSDAVLVIEQDNPANVKDNSAYLGSQSLNLNPRRMLILLKEQEQYRLLEQSEKLIPSESDEESPCLADPFLGDGGLAIQRGNLTVSLNYWLSCGSWGTSNSSYTFRYQYGQMVLIGFDRSSHSRASGMGEEVSVNFLTRKRKLTTGKSMFDEAEDKPSVSWSSFNTDRLFTLKSFDNSQERQLIEKLL